MQDQAAIPNPNSASLARRLIRGARTAVLSTSLAEDAGGAYGSLVQTASDQAGNPILLLSRLAVHTANLMRDARACLLFQDTAAGAAPLASARLSLIGRVIASAGPERAADKARYLARYPEAAAYADFADFGFYRLSAGRGHLVAGFGKIEWLPGTELRLSEADCGQLGAAEAGIIAHMNQDHADTIALYAEKLLGLPASTGPWLMCGCDPEGADLAANGQFARLPFATISSDPVQIRAELVRLAADARRIS